MSEFICGPSADCFVYCKALDRATGEQLAPGEQTDCGWPERLGDMQGFASHPESELIGLIGERLRSIKEAQANEVRHEISAVAEQMSSIFDQRLQGWKLRAEAVASETAITDVEVQHTAQKLRESRVSLRNRITRTRPEHVTTAQALLDKKCLDEYGLMFDASTIETVDRLVDNVAHSRSSLLVGDKGIAKTKTAEFCARIFSKGKEPAMISGHGSMMSDELIGKIDIVESKGTIFHEGILVECMREGRPVVLDEANLGDQQIVMRLQDILLKRPGQIVVLQEDGGEEIVVQPGFCILATANEASARYNIREQFDPAFRDRFDVVELEYPDINTPHITSYPGVSIRLALATVLSKDGLPNEHVSNSDAVYLARIAHATQRLYARPAKDVGEKLVQSTADILDETEPLLTDCITPRKMVRILERVATGTLVETTVASELALAVSSLDQNGSRNQTYVKRVIELLKKQRS